MIYHLAVDIGASSGRHMLAHMEQGRIVLEEVYRFPNGAAQRNGHLCWDLAALWQHMLEGMKRCKALGKVPATMGVDTWAVDFVLLDKAGAVLGDTVAYRDSRTAGMRERLEEALPFPQHYARTGIAYQPFNTVYQLMAVPRAQLDAAADFLMIPDYFHFLLTGQKANEYTNASTTALLNAQTRDWDDTVLAVAGIPRRMFRTPVLPGTVLGTLRSELAADVGFDCQVVLPATHDTGSAFMAVPAQGNAVYLSSGTWSLLGMEHAAPFTDDASREAGFTNEGGWQGGTRYLKNIMGLWMLQCLRHEIGDKYTFAEMAALAASAADTPYRVDVADNRFLAPASMTEALQQAVAEQGGDPLPLPELLRMVNISLAEGYARAIRQMEVITGRHDAVIHIVGGGSGNETLNQMTADATGRVVLAGPTEGTALGNAMAQMIASGELADLSQARQAERSSFPLKRYEPKHQ